MKTSLIFWTVVGAWLVSIAVFAWGQYWSMFATANIAVTIVLIGISLYNLRSVKRDLARLNELAARNEQLRDEARRYFDEARQLVAMVLRPPFGWKPVPLEPTIEMARAGGFAWEEPPFPVRYKAMLDAAPSPSATDYAGVILQ